VHSLHTADSKDGGGTCSGLETESSLRKKLSDLEGLAGSLATSNLELLSRISSPAGKFD